MPRIAYQEKRFAAKSQAIIENAKVIIEEYAADGYDLTVRQLYYQFVARDLIENSQRAYKRLGSVISDARLAGEIDWLTIVDRTRSLRGTTTWDDPQEIIRNSAYGYTEDKWADQEVMVEAWIEKDALIGVISGVCNELEIDYFSCRGYTSSSSMWRAARRMIRYNQRGQRVVILHLGDHDPSGIDMTRDIEDRLHMFGADVEVRRIALSMDQINEYQPPPNPAKLTDSRAAEYCAEYGYDSWELDALEPQVMADLIENEVLTERNEYTWEFSLENQEINRRVLTEISENFEDVRQFLEGRE
jgi:hypothetical protein